MDDQQREGVKELSTLQDVVVTSGSVESAVHSPMSPPPGSTELDDHRVNRRVVWKFGGTSVGDGSKLRAVAERLVAARREGLQVVAVLSAMASSTNDLHQAALKLSTTPAARELDALLSVGESTSCALAAIAVHELGERAVSLNGLQAGFTRMALLETPNCSGLRLIGSLRS